MKTKSVLSLVVLACLMQAGCGATFSGLRAQAERDEVMSAPLAPGQSLTADTGFGGVKVTGADVEACEVQVHVQVQAPSQEAADALLEKVYVVLEAQGNGLSLHVDKPKLGHNESVGVSYDITVPHRTRLDCTTSFGTINIRQTEGDVKARTSFGSIHCNTVAGALDLKTSHGKIDMKEVLASEIMADTSFGSVWLESRDAEGSAGRITLETSHASITAKNVRTSVLDARTSFGSVSVAYAPNGPEDLDVTLSSSHGSLAMTPPQAFTGHVELSTSHGSIQMDRPVTVQGKISKDHITGTLGNGPGSVRMNTSFASVKLR